MPNPRFTSTSFHKPLFITDEAYRVLRGRAVRGKGALGETIPQSKYQSMDSTPVFRSPICSNAPTDKS